MRSRWVKQSEPSSFTYHFGVGLGPTTFEHDLRQTCANNQQVLCSLNARRVPADSLPNLTLKTQPFKSIKIRQFASIQKQRDLHSKKEAALRAESHRKVLLQIVKMAKYAGLTLAEITSAYEGKKIKLANTPKKATKSSKKLKYHTMKGVKLPAKYKNPLNPNQTWTGMGVDPAWVATLIKSGQLELALVHSPEATLN